MARVLLSSLVVAACGSSNPAHPDAAADAPPDAHINTGMFPGTVSDMISGAPIGGAQVCSDGGLAINPKCVTSAADGTYTYTLSIPDGTTKLAIVTAASGYLGRENLLVEDATAATGYGVEWESVGGLYAQADATTLLATHAGFTYPTTTQGFVEVQVFGPSVAAVTATATISAGGNAVYFNSSGVPDTTLTDTSQNPNVLFGNLPAGTYHVTVQATGKTCSGNLNGEWPGTGGGTLDVAVTANVLTGGLAVSCQ